MSRNSCTFMNWPKATDLRFSTNSKQNKLQKVSFKWQCSKISAHRTHSIEGWKQQVQKDEASIREHRLERQRNSRGNYRKQIINAMILKFIARKNIHQSWRQKKQDILNESGFNIKKWLQELYSNRNKEKPEKCSEIWKENKK